MRWCAVSRQNRNVGVSLAAVVVASVIASSTVGLPPAIAASQLTTIPVGAFAQRIEISPDSSTAYVTGFNDDTVSVITLASQATSSITVGDQPSGVGLRPGSTELWVTNFGDDTVSVINTITQTVTQTFSVGDGPIELIFNAAGTRAYISYYNAGEIGVIDAATKAATGPAIDVDAFPMGIALDESRNRLLSVGTNANRVTVIDLLGVDPPILKTVGSSPFGIVVAPEFDRAYVSNSTSISVIRLFDLALDTFQFSVGQLDRPTGLALHPTAPLMFTANFGDGSVSVITLEGEGVLSTIDTANQTFDVAMPPDAKTLYAVNRAAGNVSVIDAELVRLQGVDRYLTAVEISKVGFAAGANVVFVASGAGFADALSAGAAAAGLDAPLLLTPPSSLLTSVRDEIARLNPDTIYVVGGPGAVSAAVVTALEALAPTVTRLQGDDRYATSRDVVSTIFTDASYSTVFVATGRNFPDALSAGPVAALREAPIVLVDGNLSTLPAATLSLITSKSPNEVVVVGGTGAVSAGIESQLGLSLNVSRVSGDDRYETSAELNREFNEAEAVMWATGTNFPDALAGISLQGLSALPVPLSLVAPTCAPAAATQSIWRNGADTIYILGGTGSVSAAVEARQAC